MIFSRIKESKFDFMNKKKILAAGGVVENIKGELLMIYRRNKWDLPKGKLDKDEPIEQCALREVQEETGVKDLKIKFLTGITHHEYFDNYTNEIVEKETHWYAMKTNGVPQLFPQTEEDITDIAWVAKEDIKNKLQNSYPSIVEVLTKYFGDM
jgi:8-oxo-dGTP pyrophosphatase MutT (NUDIX family)